MFFEIVSAFRTHFQLLNDNTLSTLPPAHLLSRIKVCR